MDREQETMAERQRTTTDPTMSDRDPYGQPGDSTYQTESSYRTDTDVVDDDRGEQGKEAMGAGAGALGGAAVGAAVGGPIGAVVGGGIGAVGGAVAGEAADSHDGGEEAGSAGDKTEEKAEGKDWDQPDRRPL